MYAVLKYGTAPGAPESLFKGRHKSKSTAESTRATRAPAAHLLHLSLLHVPQLTGTHGGCGHPLCKPLLPRAAAWAQPRAAGRWPPSCSACTSPSSHSAVRETRSDSSLTAIASIKENCNQCAWLFFFFNIFLFLFFF